MSVMSDLQTKTQRVENKLELQTKLELMKFHHSKQIVIFKQITYNHSDRLNVYFVGNLFIVVNFHSLNS